MKSEAKPRTPSTARAGIVDAIGTGLSEAARRPWLWIVPIVVDLALWLAPRLSLTALLDHLVSESRSILLGIGGGELAAAEQGIEFAQGLLTGFIKQLNLGSLLMAGWFSPPSAVSTLQASRYFLFSDAALAPARLGPEVQALATAPWQTAAFEVKTVWALLALAVPLWIVGQLLTALYFSLIARDLEGKPVGEQPGSTVRAAPGAAREARLAQWLRLAGNFAAVSLFASGVGFLLRLPLWLVTLLALLTGSGAASFLFVVGGGITLWFMMWFLSALYFTGDALAFDRQPLLTAMIQSLVLVRANGFRVLILATLVNTLLLGARALWGLLGDNPAGAVVAIIINAYLATAMTIGIYLYFQGLRRQWQAAKLGRELSK